VIPFFPHCSKARSTTWPEDDHRLVDFIFDIETYRYARTAQCSACPRHRVNRALEAAGENVVENVVGTVSGLLLPLKRRYSWGLKTASVVDAATRTSRVRFGQRRHHSHRTHSPEAVRSVDWELGSLSREVRIVKHPPFVPTACYLFSPGVYAVGGKAIIWQAIPPWL